MTTMGRSGNMSIAYVGIDPGKTGAIAVLGLNAYICDVPLISGDYDFYQMWKILGRVFERHDKLYLGLERQQAMPGQGVSSTFQTGRGYGAWEALCWITTPDFQIVSPRVWKKKLGLTGDKEASRELATKLYPSMENQLSRKKDHNRAEALLLAHYTKLIRGIYKDG